MRISSEDPVPPRLDRAKAWSCLISNLLVLPGLGSVMAGCKEGYLQILLALAGAALTLVAAVRIALVWLQDLELPGDASLYRTCLLGLGLFLAGWVWSLFTSWKLFRPGP